MANCTTKCNFKLKDKGEWAREINEHFYLSHSLCKKCEKCDKILSTDFLYLHQRLNCNNELVAQYLKVATKKVKEEQR